MTYSCNIQKNLLVLTLCLLVVCYAGGWVSAAAIDSIVDPINQDILVGSNITDLKAYRVNDNTSLQIQLTTKDAKSMTTTVAAKNNAEASTESACGDGFCNREGNEHLSSDPDCQADCPEFCGNGYCNQSIPETCSNCPQDCTVCAPTCGDGTCNGTETCSTCSQDCGACCGNGTCDNGETYLSCPEDGCPHCPDGVCEPNLGETRASCSADCKCGDGVCESGIETCGAPLYCITDCGGCGGGGGSEGGSCLLAGTPITMADGTVKPIEQIRRGDKVLAFDKESNRFKPDKVTKVLKHTSTNGYLLINGHLKITPNHPVISDGYWVQVGFLKEGHRLLNTQGEYEEIKTLERFEGNNTTYNLEVNPYHTYIAGGYVVHNGVREKGKFGSVDILMK